MNYLHAALTANAGDIVEVTLTGNAANVFLLDAIQFMRYQLGHSFNFIGGFATQTPYRVQVPITGSWTLVVDLRGTAGDRECDFSGAARVTREIESPRNHGGCL